jgi:hypothetical protein
MFWRRDALVLVIITRLFPLWSYNVSRGYRSIFQRIKYSLNWLQNTAKAHISGIASFKTCDVISVNHRHTCLRLRALMLTSLMVRAWGRGWKLFSAAFTVTPTCMSRPMTRNERQKFASSFIHERPILILYVHAHPIPYYYALPWFRPCRSTTWADSRSTNEHYRYGHADPARFDRHYPN